MKSKAMIVIGFILGLLVGAVATFVFMGINTRKVMAIYADAQLLEMAVNADLIRAGKGDKLLERYDVAIPRNAAQFADYHWKYLRGNQKHAALWAVQRYYEDNPSVAVPPELQPILGSLPPRPRSSCGLRREDAAESKAEANADTGETAAPGEQENASN